jgi:hypothetical protein
MKHKDGIPGFLTAADAIVACKACGAEEGQPCTPGDELKPGFVHFARRIKRLLLTAKRPDKRGAFEAEAVKLLQDHMRERA